MATNQKIITDLDFDTIKNNLKTFMKTQTEFLDYDFEGSGLNILLDLLAYNTHYNAYYLNMVANESFMDTAILRDSVVGHAKTLGYIPHSAKAARAGKDIGKPGKNFEKIAKSAGERYGSKERGEKVAGAVLAKLRAKTN